MILSDTNLNLCVGVGSGCRSAFYPIDFMTNLGIPVRRLCAGVLQQRLFTSCAPKEIGPLNTQFGGCADRWSGLLWSRWGAGDISAQP